MREPPTGVHRFVRLIWQQTEADVRLVDLANDAGLDERTLRKWIGGESGPKLNDVEAVLNTLGYEMIVQPKETRK